MPYLDFEINVKRAFNNVLQNFKNNEKKSERVELENYYQEKKTIIEEAIKEFLKIGDIERLEITRHLMKGGKKFRGFLALLVCDALNGSTERALDAAVAIELVHSSSLAHDDIMDLDEKRRGDFAAWVKFGLTKTILILHYLIPHAQLMIRKYGMAALETAIKTWETVVKGQIKDILMQETSAYETVAFLKTGGLFAGAATLGAIAAEREDFMDIASEYGRKFGFAYQIADDIVDLNKYIKREISSTPTLNAFIRFLGYSSQFNDKIIDIAFGKLDKGIRATVGLVKQFPDSKYKILLEKFPTFCVAQMLNEAKLNFNSRF